MLQRKESLRKSFGISLFASSCFVEEICAGGNFPFSDPGRYWGASILLIAKNYANYLGAGCVT